MNREPVVLSALFLALIESGIVLARLMGWLQMNEEQFGGLMLFVAAMTAVGSFVLRNYITPMSDPIDDDGVPLVRADRMPLLRDRNT